MTKYKAVLFDRDGVLNKSIVIDKKPFPPKSVNECQLTEGIEHLCQYLKTNDYRIFIITNQPDIARGKTSLSEVNKINNFLKDKLNLDAIYCCPHDDSDHCDCRKPKPGMILKAKNEFDLDLEKSFVIGDRWKDIQAGEKAGCTTIFIDYGYDEKKIKSNFTVNSTEKIIEIFKEKGI